MRNVRRLVLLFATTSASAAGASVGALATGCSKSSSSSSDAQDAGADAPSDAAGDGAATDPGGDAAACLPPGQSCQGTCCAPATCDKSSGPIGTCCLPLGARCTDAKDCCIQPGAGTTTCSPGDGGLVCTQKTI